MIANAAGIESTAKAMSAATIAARQRNSGVAWRRPVDPHEPVLAVVLARDREDAAHPAHDEVLVRVDVLLDALEDPVGEHEQQHAEHVDDEVELLDQRDAAEDRQAAQHERGDDAPEQQPRAELLGHAEVREQQEEDEEVVERQRALDEVDGRVGDGVLGVRQDQHDDRGEQRDRRASRCSRSRPRGSSARGRARRSAGRRQRQHDRHARPGPATAPARRRRRAAGRHQTKKKVSPSTA